VTDAVTVEQDGHLLLIGVNRPDANNLWNLDVIQGVIDAYGRLAEDDGLRVGVVFGHGKHFTAGLDLVSVAPQLAGGESASIVPEGAYDPWDFFGEPCPKPVVVAVHGACNTLGIELIMASQAAVAADDTRFAQLEVARGIVPLAGASFRLLSRLGPVGMRYMLTAEKFDAQAALQHGLVSEVVPVGQHLERACDIAREIAGNAPLAVQAAMASARAAERAARDAAREVIVEWNKRILTSADAMEGVQAMIQRRPPNFEGK
jgi:enoyl-CoA hydratase/carnithine racemase